MKNDINAARRKLVNSVNPTLARDVGVFYVQRDRPFHQRESYQQGRVAGRLPPEARMDESPPSQSFERGNNPENRIRELEVTLHKSRSEAQFFRRELTEVQSTMIQMERLRKDNQELQVRLHSQNQLVRRATYLQNQKKALQGQVDGRRARQEALARDLQMMSEENRVIKSRQVGTGSTEGAGRDEEIRNLTRQLIMVQKQNESLSSVITVLKT